MDRQILQTLKTKDEPTQNAQTVETTQKSLVSNDTIRSGEPMSIKEIIDSNRERILIGRVDNGVKKSNEDDGVHRGVRR